MFVRLILILIYGWYELFGLKLKMVFVIVDYIWKFEVLFLN